MLATVTFTFTVAQCLAGETFDRVKSDGVLVVGTNANWPPQSFLNDQNEMDGFDVDAAKEIASRLGVGIKFVTPAWEVMTSGNWKGRWDITIGSMTPTSVRAKVLDFPAVYYYTPASAAVHEDSKSETPSDLSGKVVGATTASTFELYLKNDLTIDAQGVPPFEYQIQPAETRTADLATSILDDLRLGDGVRLDGMVGSLPALLDAIESGYPIRVLGDPVFYEPLSLAIDEGDAEFAEALARAVDAMKEDGNRRDDLDVRCSQRVRLQSGDAPHSGGAGIHIPPRLASTPRHNAGQGNQCRHDDKFGYLMRHPTAANQVGDTVSDELVIAVDSVSPPARVVPSSCTCPGSSTRALKPRRRVECANACPFPSPMPSSESPPETSSCLPNVEDRSPCPIDLSLQRLRASPGNDEGVADVRLTPITTQGRGHPGLALWRSA